jgi:uncharacterized membrane protein
LVSGYLNTQCAGSVATCFSLTTMRRLSYFGGLPTLLILLGIALAFLVKAGSQKSEIKKLSSSDFSRLPPFVILLILLGALLVIAPEFVYLRDLFGYRINTVFKFYYQAWLLWSLAAAFSVAVLLQKLHGAQGVIFRICLVLVLFMALTYPVLGLQNKTSDFQLPAFAQSLKAARAEGDPSALKTAAGVWTLDGAKLFQGQYPNDAAAAFSKSSSYSDYGRMSAYSGDPTVLGWWYHEWQWRGSVDEQVSLLPNLTCRAKDAYDSRRMRSDDISCLYEARSWDVASQVIYQYHVRYVVIGTLERRDYHINEQIFRQHLTQVFQQGQVVIYEVPQSLIGS